MQLMGKEEYACLEIIRLNKNYEILCTNSNYSKIIHEIEKYSRMLLCVQKQVLESQTVLDRVENEHKSLSKDYSNAQYVDNHSFHVS